MGLWGFEQAPRPFVDADYVINQITCWDRGVNIYVHNPCDAWNRVHDYSPLWLRLSVLKAVPGWLFGLGQDVAFALALAFLPLINSRRSVSVVMLALISPTVVFGLERGNVDLIMIALTITGLACLERRPWIRNVGFAAFLAAALLKFYPIVLFIKTLDERPRRFFAILSVTAAIVLASIIGYHDEIGLALKNVPVPIPFGDGFSSYQLGDGVAMLLHQPWTARPLWMLFVLIATAGAAYRATNIDFQTAYAAVDTRSAACLVAGSVLFCGCYLAGPSVGYRGMVLLLVLPGILDMIEHAPTRQFRRAMVWMAGVILFAMWNLALMRRLLPGSVVGDSLGALPLLAVWCLREAAWWMIFTVLLAVLIRYVWTSRIGQDARNALRSARKPAH